MANTVHLVREKKRLHFIGIGGVGMSALAEIFATRGYQVSGSDVKSTPTITRLQSSGCTVSIGHKGALPHTDVVIYSSAIAADNAELQTATERAIPVLHRSELLATLLNKPHAIGITGTHGKTTTSALTAFIFERLGYQPTCLVGGTMLNYDTNTLIGDGEVIIAEVDESDKTLMHLQPEIVVITNLEAEHLDTYRDLADLKTTIHAFIAGLSPSATVIYNYDDETLRDIMPHVRCRTIHFGLDPRAAVSARDVTSNGTQTTFRLFIDATFIDTVTVPLAGIHNVYNTLAAIAATHAMDIESSRVVPLLRGFKGTARRIEITYQDDELIVVDDYAHHPTEIAVTIDVLRAMKAADAELIVVFQPHRFSRTLHLREAFGTCFNAADRVIITDLYGAGEKSITGVSEQIIVDEIKQRGSCPVTYVPPKKIVNYLLQAKLKEALIAFLGAGTITEIAHDFSTAVKSCYS